MTYPVLFTQGLLHPRHCREAVRQRPRLVQRPLQTHRSPLRRGGDLPHRPLPRQGNGPEHNRAALRQQDHEAAVEPGLDRLRHSHIQGAVRHSGTRRLLRRVRHHTRHHAEPLASGMRL